MRGGQRRFSPGPSEGASPAALRAVLPARLRWAVAKAAAPERREVGWVAHLSAAPAPCGEMPCFCTEKRESRRRVMPSFCTEGRAARREPAT